MGIAIEKMFAQLLFWVYDFLDAVFETFRVLAGMQPLDVNGEEMSLVNVFLTHSTVTQVFMGIFLLSIIVAAICAVVKVISSIVNLKGGERKPHGKTLAQTMAVIPTTLVVALVMVMFIFVSTSMLSFVEKSFNSSYEKLNLSQMLFDLSVAKSYVYDYDNPKREPIYVLDAAGQKIPIMDEATGQQKEENGELVWEIQKDESGNPMYEETYNILKDENGNELLFSGWQKRGGDEINGYVYYTPADLDFATMTPDKIFGIHKKTLGLFEDGGMPYTQKAMVELESFNLWTAYLVAVIMLVVIIWAMLGLVKRVFDLTFLFLALPLVSATIPLDDGAKFKTWRDTVVSKVILAFGVVFSINIFLLMLPIIQQIDFGSLGWSATVVTVFKIFLILGGALSINGGQLLAARLVGADASESREMTQAARALVGGTMAAGGLARGAKNAVFGGTNKYGRKVGGALPVAARIGGGAANAVGNALGGAAYRSGVNKSKAAIGNIANALRGITRTNEAQGRGGAAVGQPAPAAQNKQGLLHNGLLGAAHKTAGNRQAKTPMGSRLMAPLGKPPITTKQKNLTNQKGGSNYVKHEDKSSVDDMVKRMALKPKDGDSGAMKKQPTPKK